MKAVGIIAEYNPLHYGHIYHIEESKKLAGKDAVVVAMSGNYIQHGEPAILDKWERAKLAVLHGADVVVEIPALFCLGNSMQYATAGVKILDSIGVVSHLSFGSESGDVEVLKEVADVFSDKKEEMEACITELARTEGMSYPRARALAYERLTGKTSAILDSSNDNLALSYLSVQSGLEPIAVKREGAEYNEDISDSIYQSATGIRNALDLGKEVREYIPEDVYNSINSSIITRPNDWLSCLKFAVMSMSADEIDDCPSGGEGLGNKIKKEINAATSWDDLIHRVKSKRYTYSRISRLLMQIVLGINRRIYNFEEPGYIRILALSNKGRTLISDSEKNELNKLPIITNINKQSELLDSQSKKMLKLDVHASDVYNLVTERPQDSCSDYRRRPFIQE